MIKSILTLLVAVVLFAGCHSYHSVGLYVPVVKTKHIHTKAHYRHNYYKHKTYKSRSYRHHYYKHPHYKPYYKKHHRGHYSRY